MRAPTLRRDSAACCMPAAMPARLGVPPPGGSRDDMSLRVFIVKATIGHAFTLHTGNGSVSLYRYRFYW